MNHWFIRTCPEHPHWLTLFLTLEYTFLLLLSVSTICGSRFQIRMVSSEEQVINEADGRTGLISSKVAGFTWKSERLSTHLDRYRT